MPWLTTIHGLSSHVLMVSTSCRANGFFRHKLSPDGTLDRYKARWVVRGFSQQPGVDFD